MRGIPYNRGYISKTYASTDYPSLRERKKHVDEKLQEIAFEKKVKLSTVRAIWESQFKVVRHHIENMTYKSIRLNYFGKFVLSPKKLQIVNHEYGIAKVRKRRKSGSTPSGTGDSANQADTSAGQE